MRHGDIGICVRIKNCPSVEGFFIYLALYWKRNLKNDIELNNEPCQIVMSHVL